MKKKTWIIIVIAAVVLIGAWLLSSYNNLVSANEAVDGQWAQVEAQYQR
jgi:LemA protein